MKKLIIGTRNPAKIDQISGALKDLKIVVMGPNSDAILPEVAENGPTAADNARTKALAYTHVLDQPVLSTDNALYLDSLPNEQQPGLHVRRIPTQPQENRPTDAQLLEYYSQLIDSLGGRVNGHWEFAICVAKPDGRFWETTIPSPRTFVSQPCKAQIPGYPLESIQVNPETGRYLAELSEKEQAEFWQKKIGRPLADFINKLEL